MKSRFLAGLLALALAVGLSVPALAAEVDVASKFPAVNTYPGFADVADGDWYADTVKLCYEVGLMKGTDGGFNPAGTMTIAETVVIAARIHDILNGGDGVMENSEGAAHWYTGAMTHIQRLNQLQGNDQIAQVLAFPDSPAPRLAFLKLLALVTPADLLAPINSITALPDIDDGNVLDFYNAGILTGVNPYGTFRWGGSLSRAECAAMVARLVRPELRAAFAPAAADLESPDFDLASYATGYSGDLPYLLWGDLTVNLDAYSQTVVRLAETLHEQCKAQGVAFSWNNTYGGKTFLAAVEESANDYSLYAAWEQSELAPVALEAGLAEWAASTTQLKAQHILVEEESLARDLYAQLQADPNRFDALLLQYGVDPGMKQNPGGYVFGPGEMAAEFEAGTKALLPGEIGAPIQSQHGWHIIRRLPLALEDYQAALNAAAWTAYMDRPDLPDALFSPDIQSLDMENIYDAYLKLAEG